MGTMTRNQLFVGLVVGLTLALAVFLAVVPRHRGGDSSHQANLPKASNGGVLGSRPVVHGQKGGGNWPTEFGFLAGRTPIDAEDTSFVTNWDVSHSIQLIYEFRADPAKVLQDVERDLKGWTHTECPDPPTVLFHQKGDTRIVRRLAKDRSPHAAWYLKHYREFGGPKGVSVLLGEGWVRITVSEGREPTMRERRVFQLWPEPPEPFGPENWLG